MEREEEERRQAEEAERQRQILAAQQQQRELLIQKQQQQQRLIQHQQQQVFRQLGVTRFITRADGVVRMTPLHARRSSAVAVSRSPSTAASSLPQLLPHLSLISRGVPCVLPQPVGLNAQGQPIVFVQGGRIHQINPQDPAVATVLASLQQGSAQLQAQAAQAQQAAQAAQAKAQAQSASSASSQVSPRRLLLVSASGEPPASM